MKYKRDLVTNSSSASFIVGDLRDKNKRGSLPAKIIVDFDLIGDLSADTISTIEELDKHDYFKFYMEVDNELIQREHLKCKEIIEKGGVIHFIVTDSGAGEVGRDLYEYGIIGRVMFISHKIEVIKG